VIAGRVRRLAAVLLAAGVLAAGCSRPDDTDQERRLAVCVAPTAERKAGDPVKIEFRRAGERVAAGEIPVGAVFAAPVPAGADIEVYADGSLVGSSSRGTAYLHGDGCPATPTG
jgi:hypothetical protein